MKYAKAKFRKRHELDQLKRIQREPRYLKQRNQMQSAAWKNYFFSQVETNDIINEIKRMEGHIDHMIRPVSRDYLEKLKGEKLKLQGELAKRPVPPPPVMN